MSNKVIHPIEFEEKKKSETYLGIDVLSWILLAVSCVCFVVGLFFDAGTMLRLVLMLLSFLCSGYGTVTEVLDKLTTHSGVDEKLLAVAAAMLAFITGRDVDGAGCMLFFAVMQLLYRYTVTRSRKSVMEAVDPRGNTAVLLDEDGEHIVKVSSLKPGDTVLLNPGEVAPVDCVVLEGTSVLDLSFVNGNAEPVAAVEGDTIPAGALNLSSQLQLEVASGVDSSSMNRMWQMLHGEDYHTRFEAWFGFYRRWYVIGAGALTVVLTILYTLLGRKGFGNSLHRASVVLVIANPTVFSAALSMTYYTGLRGAAHRGVIFKGSGPMEAASVCKSVLLDQNGTVTSRGYHVASVKAPKIDSRILLKCAAHAAANASSEAMQAVVNAYGGEIDYSVIGSFVEYPEGVTVEINNIPVLMGSRIFLQDKGIVLGVDDANEDNALHISLGRNFAGSILLACSVQSSSAQTMNILENELGCRDVILISSDPAEKAASIADAGGIRKYYAQCLPMDKLARVQEICDRTADGTTLYVAAVDADASILTAADAGVYLGSADSDGAEEADIVIPGEDVSKLAEAIRSAQNTSAVLRQALLGAAGIKAVLLLLSVLGLSTSLWFAALIDGAAAVGAVLNSVRAFPIEK